ncbi:MAG TPA: NAD(P)H-hydrate dehydratase [Longimicrobiaceae bacterium]|nr:NAD(P)H-hydrate dehydratase [Longimicrobiaceae bacterium]
MGSSLLPLLTAAEMRRWDRRAIDEAGVPEAVLMESAGRAAAGVLQRLFPEGRVVAAVGAGNNGGDALVTVRTLSAWGREVAVLPVGGAELRADLLHGWEVRSCDAAALTGAAVLVDGILGTGARGAPRRAQAGVIRAMNATGVPIVALDGPSGVDLSTGAVPGEAIRARVTIAFGAPKRGLLLFPGRVHAARVTAVEIGFPPLAAGSYAAALTTPAWVREHLPVVPANAHKGITGAVTIVAGRAGMAGASVMAAMGALRAGAGMVRVVGPEENRIVAQAAVPEALFVGRAGDVDGALAAADAVLAGPGMGTDDEAHELLRRILRLPAARLVLDADALTLLADDPGLLEQGAARRVVLTPHPGEMGRLLGREAATVVADPLGAAGEAAARFRCTVLLKGAPSLVAAPGEPILVNPTGTSGVATGGMGDTLAGIVAALLAAGADVRTAAALAIFLAGRAAEMARRGRSLLPRDIAATLPLALAEPDRADGLDLPGVLLDLPEAE